MNHIYFAGYDAQHPDDFIFDIPEGYDCYLLLLTTTPARFWVNGQTEEYPAHCAILYPPRHKIWYGASGQPYGNDWIRFASDEAFIRHFPHSAYPFLVSDPAYCHSLFQLLTWESSRLPETSGQYRPNTRTPSEKGTSEPNEQIISQLLRILFTKLQSDVLHHAALPHDHDLLTLRRQIVNAPHLPWNVSEMAKQLHVSPGHLHLLYKQKFGISCMDDVIESRIRKAKDLLAFSDHSVAEIAYQSGYQNVEHFCRQFRKITGRTPGSFRKEQNKS